MVEDIGKIISNGFETYSKNLNLGIPFVLNFFISQILSFIFFSVGFSYILGPEFSSLDNTASPEQIFSIIFPLLKSHIFELVFLMLLFILISLFLSSFFVAGAIGMAKQATENGKSEISTMVESGKKNVASLFLANILVGLLFLAGLAFLVPGAIVRPSSGGIGPILLLGGFLLWVIYVIILTIVLAVFSYAIVIDNLEPVDGILAGFNFFNKHKSDVFLLWLIILIILIVVILGLILLGVKISLSFMEIAIIFVSIFVISPLSTVLWTRLYMTRTGKKIYFNELLAHPNDLEKLKSD